MNIVITGASTGIGYQTALQLAREGHTVFAVARRKDKLAELQSQALKENADAKLHFLAGDLSGEAFIGELYREISSTTGTVDVLINNAGRLINKPFADLTADDWMQVYSTNLFAVVHLIKFLLPLFPADGWKHIVNISSMGGFQGSAKFPGLSAYSSSKAALAGLTECLAEEFKDRNISVNCLCLGSVDTEMFHAAFPQFKAASTSEEIAILISRFATESGKLFNGKIIPVSSTTP
jgi:NAD(P)-dependent dehydrogenase (short-subunit alcohol dehydrogenase family)